MGPKLLSATHVQFDSGNSNNNRSSTSMACNTTFQMRLIPPPASSPRASPWHHAKRKSSWKQFKHRNHGTYQQAAWYTRSDLSLHFQVPNAMLRQLIGKSRKFDMEWCEVQWGSCGLPHGSWALAWLWRLVFFEIFC